MKESGPRSVGDLLQAGDISRLRSEAAARRELADRVRAELPDPESKHLVGAHFDDSGRLVLGMDSSAWAARVRYSQTMLLGREIRVRVAVPEGAGGIDAKPG
jgi:hypothetical protein